MATSSRYITYPIPVDPRDYIAKAFAYLQAKNPEWFPHEGQLDVWITESQANEAADLATLFTRVPKAIFRFFGMSLFGVNPIDASAATVQSTWFFSDNLGHTITAGTQVAIADSSGDLFPFVVMLDVIIPGGNTQTTTGEVLLVALAEGAEFNDLGSDGGPVILLDTLVWVDHITQVTPTSGGVDAETDDTYLDRLSLELQTMSPRPILPRDFSILARNIAGVQRAVTINGYDPAAGTMDNERMVAVAAVDVDGTPVSDIVKFAISTYLQLMREQNFVVNTFDPAVIQVDVVAHVTVQPDYDPTDVIGRVIQAITNYLKPNNWGLTPDDNPLDPQTWNNSVFIPIFDVGTVVRQTPGVSRVVTLELARHGETFVSSDLDLFGAVPLPNPGTITAEAVL